MMYGFMEGDPNYWRENNSPSDGRNINYNGNPQAKAGRPECAICMERFRERDVVSPMPCHVNHLFHTRCIRPWLLKNKNCPLCKFELHPDALSNVSGSFMLNRSISQDRSGTSQSRSMSARQRTNVSSDDVVANRLEARGRPASRYL